MPYTQKDYYEDLGKEVTGKTVGYAAGGALGAMANGKLASIAYKKNNPDSEFIPNYKNLAKYGAKKSLYENMPSEIIGIGIATGINLALNKRKNIEIKSYEVNVKGPLLRALLVFEKRFITLYNKLN